MQDLLNELNRIVWGNGLLVLLLGTGIFCLCSGKYAALRSLRLLRRRGERSSGHRLSAFQACTTSLAAAMGTGNIVGVATALTLGGSGAIFWMWAAAIVGMALIYAENVLGCRFRRTDGRGNLVCGAMAYLRYGLGSPKLAAAFAVCCVGASFGMGNMTQSNAMAQTLEVAFSLPPLVTGAAAAAITGAVILGGAKRIGRFTQAAVPLLSAVYLLAAGFVLWRFRAELDDAFLAIFQEAFGISAVGGGISGAAVQRALSVGLRRGVFSNEAGLGSSSVLHGEADGDHPERLGALGICEVFLDTFVCCTATALVILCTGALDTGADGGALVLAAFRAGMGKAADSILPPVIALFALCTLIGWSYCGSSAAAYLTGGAHVRTYRVVFCLAAAIGAVLELELVWTLADIANAGMAYCNLPALVLLYPLHGGKHSVTAPPGTAHAGCSTHTGVPSCAAGCGTPHSARDRA